MTHSLIKRFNLSHDSVPTTDIWQALYDALKKQENVQRRYGALLQQIENAVILFDLDLKIVQANDRAATLLGYTMAEDLIGQHANQHLKIEDKESAEEIYSRLLAGEDIVPYRRTLKSADNNTITMIITVRLLRDDDNNPEYIQSIMRDISTEERARASENRARAHAQQTLEFIESILNNSSDGIVVLDKDGLIQQTNPAFNQMYKYKPDATFNQPITALFPHEDMALVVSSLHYVVDEWQSLRFEARAVAADLAQFNADVVLSPIITRDKTLSGVVCTIRDNTAFKQLTDSLAQSRDEALEATRTKSEFLAMMSHEIRTPMNSIIGMGEVLSDTALNDEQEELVDILMSESKVLLHLLNNILDFSKIEAKRMILDIQPYSLRDIIEGVGLSLSYSVRQNHVAILTFVDPTIPNHVFVDGGRLRQVILNLATNALKFTKVGHVLIEVLLLEQTKQTISLQFSVRDTGIGIPNDKFNTLFEPFSQADTSHTRKYGGTGLGLPIAQGIVNLMGSVIEVSSQVGVGSNFQFTATWGYETDDNIAETSSLSNSIAFLFQLPSEIKHIIQSYLQSWSVQTVDVQTNKELEDSLGRIPSETTPMIFVFTDFLEHTKSVEVPSQHIILVSATQSDEVETSEYKTLQVPILYDNLRVLVE